MLFSTLFYCQRITGGYTHFFRKDGNSLYNSIAVIDADGSVWEFTKTYIPDDHYYQEKFYFTPGNTGFKVWETRYAKIGIGICWDQWF